MHTRRTSTYRSEDRLPSELPHHNHERSDEKHTSTHAPSKNHASQNPHRNLRIFIISQLILLVVLITYIFIAPIARNHLATQKSTLLTGQAQMLKALSSMPNPTEMQPGIQNSQSRYVMNETARQTEQLTEAVATLQLSRNTQLLHYITPDSPLASASKNLSDIDSIANEVQKQSDNYTQLLQATIQLIEYNPRIDTEAYLIDTADASERMRRLTQGLTDTAQAVETVPLDSASAAGVLAIVDQVRVAQQELTRSNDVVRFVASVEQYQSDLVIFLAEYQQNLQANIRSELVRMARLIQ